MAHSNHSEYSLWETLVLKRHQSQENSLTDCVRACSTFSTFIIAGSSRTSLMHVLHSSTYFKLIKEPWNGWTSGWFLFKLISPSLYLPFWLKRNAMQVSITILNKLKTVIYLYCYTSLLNIILLSEFLYVLCMSKGYTHFYRQSVLISYTGA
jgi:hypothetical protein